MINCKEFDQLLQGGFENLTSAGRQNKGFFSATYR